LSHVTFFGSVIEFTVVGDEAFDLDEGKEGGNDEFFYERMDSENSRWNPRSGRSCQKLTVINHSHLNVCRCILSGHLLADRPVAGWLPSGGRATTAQVWLCLRDLPDHGIHSKNPWEPQT
jgi:hypothetical protein